MLPQSDSIWVRSKLWMTTEHLPEQTGLSSPLCRPWILQLRTQHHSPYTLCHCKKSQNRSSQAFSSSPLCPRFFKPFLLVRISDCRWVDWTQCLGGGSGDSSPTRLILGSTCLLCRDFTSCLPESVLGSANSNLLSLVTFFLLFDFSFSSFSPPHPQNGQGVWLVQSWRELMVTDIGQQQNAHGLWLERPTETVRALPVCRWHCHS